MPSLKVVGLQSHFSWAGQSEHGGRGDPGPATAVKSLINSRAVLPPDGSPPTRASSPRLEENQQRAGCREEAGPRGPEDWGWRAARLGARRLWALHHHRAKYLRCCPQGSETAAPTKLQLKRQGGSPEAATDGIGRPGPGEIALETGPAWLA